MDNRVTDLRDRVTDVRDRNRSNSRTSNRDNSNRRSNRRSNRGSGYRSESYGRSSNTYARNSNSRLSDDVAEERIRDDVRPEILQGGSLKTWSFESQLVERVQVLLETEGRPLDADIDLWQGPNNSPYKMRVYSEDGAYRPFSAVIETPRGPNTVAIRNTGQL